MLRLKYIVLNQNERVKSFAQAVLICAENSVNEVEMTFVDEEGKETVLKFTGTEFSNVPTFLEIKSPE